MSVCLYIYIFVVLLSIFHFLWPVCMYSFNKLFVGESNRMREKTKMTIFWSITWHVLYYIQFYCFSECAQCECDENPWENDVSIVELFV